MAIYLAFAAIFSLVGLIGCVVGFGLNDYARFQLWCLLRAVYTTMHTMFIGGVYSGVVALASMQLIQQL